MRIVAFGLFLVLFSAAGSADGGLELRLTARLSEQLPYLYPNMRLEVVNASPGAVLFPANAFDVFLYLETNEGWRKCRPLLADKRVPLSSIDWQKVDSGGVFPTGIPGSRCAKGEGPWFEWANEPGVHRVRAELMTYAHRIGVPEGAFDGVLKSNVLEFRIKEPLGIDAEAIAWAGGSPMRVELLERFPTSEYAAFFVYGKLRRIDGADPVKIRSLIERGLYPGPSSVPEGDGWKSLNSESYARWQVEWGQRVLREHPRFPFRDEVRAAVALAQMSIGEQTAALEALTDIAEKGSVEAAAWARAFLDAEPRE